MTHFVFKRKGLWWNVIAGFSNISEKLRMWRTILHKSACGMAAAYSEISSLDFVYHANVNSVLINPCEEACSELFRDV